MITEYHRPNNLEEALTLLARRKPVTRPLAGGSALNKPSRNEFAVVDLQNLGLDQVWVSGKNLQIGATFTLQKLLDGAKSNEISLPPGLVKAIEHEATYNLRQVASVVGTMIAADGRSPFTTAMYALDATFDILPGEVKLSLSEVLPFRGEQLTGRLITQVTIPLNAALMYEYVARTPADLPVVCVAAAIWPSGRTRIALGGFGKAPILAFDGTETEGAQAAAQSAYRDAEDEWASAAYRSEIAGVLTGRALAQAQ